jgi:hypothetical protein
VGNQLRTLSGHSCTELGLQTRLALTGPTSSDLKNKTKQLIWSTTKKILTLFLSFWFFLCIFVLYHVLLSSALSPFHFLMLLSMSYNMHLFWVVLEFENIHLLICNFNYTFSLIFLSPCPSLLSLSVVFSFIFLLSLFLCPQSFLVVFILSRYL